MRFKLTLLIIIVSISSSYAQNYIADGSRLLGGGFSVNLTDENTPANQISTFDGVQITIPDLRETNSSGFTLNPYYGYFFNEESLVGVSLTFSNQNSRVFFPVNNDEFSNDITNQTVGVGAFLRRYFQGTEKFGFYLQPQVGYLRSKRDYNEQIVEIETIEIVRDFTEERISNAINLSIRGGLYYFILDQMSIETNIIQGNFLLEQIKWTQEDPIEEFVGEGEGDRSSASLSFANAFTFDQLFTLNFYF